MYGHGADLYLFYLYLFIHIQLYIYIYICSIPHDSAGTTSTITKNLAKKRCQFIADMDALRYTSSTCPHARQIWHQKLAILHWLLAFLAFLFQFPSKAPIHEACCVATCGMVCVRRWPAKRRRLPPPPGVFLGLKTSAVCQKNAKILGDRIVP